MKLSNKKKNNRKTSALKKQVSCPNCKQQVTVGDGHFAPPSLGEKGFFICQN
jgi:hypothetical protein